MQMNVLSQHCLEGLGFARFRFTISPLGMLYLPAFKGSTLRGGFGAALKHMVCLMGKESCTNCILRDRCAYCTIFESPRPLGSNVERSASYDPHPFVIEPPLEARQEYLPGERLAFNVVLVGKGTDYFPYFILAFKELGGRGIGKGKGGFELIKVENITEERDGGRLMWDGESQTVRTDYKVTRFNDILEQIQGLNPSAVTLHFVTPTRIKWHGSLIAEIDFETFMRNLLRRLAWLSELYCGQRWDIDYTPLLEQAIETARTAESDIHWYEWERYTSRQDTRLKMGGFIGSITFEGELGEFLPFIKMGEYLHVGQGTAFGLGKYIMETSGGKQKSRS